MARITETSLPVTLEALPRNTVRNTTGPSFREVMQQQLAGSEVRLSAHARQRLAERGINLSPAQRERLEQATRQAADKGARESLILLDDLAFVVNVPNRTVITAVECGQLEAGVFTNIDSAVLNIEHHATGWTRNGKPSGAE